MAKSPAPPAISSPWRTRTETAEYLRVSPLTVDNMVIDGRLKAYSAGPRIVRFHIDDINAALGRS